MCIPIAAQILERQDSQDCVAALLAVWAWRPPSSVPTDSTRKWRPVGLARKAPRRLLAWRFMTGAMKRRSLSENARAPAIINMAMNDSLVGSFLNRYTYNFWRPERAIHAGNTDGNPNTGGDPTWAPIVVTPCFPSYPSNHGRAGNGAAEIMRRLYGDDGLSMQVDESCGTQHHPAIHLV